MKLVAPVLGFELTLSTTFDKDQCVKFLSLKHCKLGCNIMGSKESFLFLVNGLYF